MMYAMLHAMLQDANNSLEIDEQEFYVAMRSKLGYTGPKHVIDLVFKSLDLDRSGVIGFDELFEFIRGRRHSLDARSKRVRAMHLAPPGGGRLEDVLWNVSTLRLLIQQMLGARAFATMLCACT